MPPNFEPIVSTGRLNAATASVPTTSATIEPGTRGNHRGDQQHERQRADGEGERGRIRSGHRRAPAAAMRAKNSLGGSPMPRPKKSLICVEAMSSAMPLVKPSTTGRGMNFTACPSPVTRQDHQDDAGHHRHHQQAGHAVRGDDARDDHDERPGRSADLDARAAEQRDEESADDGCVDARLGRDAGRDPERHRQGSATTPTVRPATRSAQ